MEGFKDSRTQAELLLAPKRPLARNLNAVSALKLNLGGPAAPGVISSAAQITGPVRNALTASLKQKAMIAALSGSVIAVLTGFDAKHNQLTAGTFIPPDPLLVKPSAFPDVSSFFTFSSLAVGTKIPASFITLIEQRKRQLQQLVKSLSSASRTVVHKGVSVVENTDPKPYPLPDEVDRPDVPPLAQGGKAAQNDAILKDKTRFTVHGVTIGSGKPNSWKRQTNAADEVTPNLNVTVNQVFRDRHKSGTWSEPPSAYAAQFPYNHVQQTEAGHVFELDDTPGAERVHLFHRAGSFIEMHPNGDVVYKNMKNGYRVTMADEHVKVTGSCHVAVDGNSTLYVKGNVEMQTDGDMNVLAKGDYNVFAKNINLRAKKTFKADGTLIDLRYVVLPTNISFEAPSGVPFPRVNLTAIHADFPDNNIEAAQDTAQKAAMDPNAGHLPVSLGEPTANTPQQNPLSNWSAYTVIGAAAIAYRAKFFDTPEEVNDVELYAGHTSLQADLGDTAAESRRLGGTLRNFDSGLVEPDTKPTVNLLNFDDFKGTYDYANNYVVGGTTFMLSDLSDLSLHADIVQDTMPLTEDDFGDTPDDPSGEFGNAHPGDGSGSGGDSGNGSDNGHEQA